MSGEKVEIVLLRIAVRADTRRSLDQKVLVHLSGVSRALFRILWLWMKRLSPHSRPRRYAIRVLAPRVLEMLNGRETWIEGQRRWLADWGEFRYEPDEVLDLGGDRLLLVGRVRGVGRGSGVEIDSEWGLLATISDGLLAREQSFLDKAEALEAASLKPT